MTLSLRRRTVVLAGLAGAVLPAFAQDYPNRPIKIVVGYAPGGGPDIVARIVAMKLQKVLGQTVIIENRAGAGGTLATLQFASAPPDGYTLLLGETAQLEIAPFVYKKLGYDPLKDFTHISLLGASPGAALVSNASFPKLRTVQNLIEEARANPGKLNYGSSGNGSIHNIVMEVFKSELGLDIVHVPYKGSGQSVPALLAGEIQLAVNSLQLVMEDVKAGKLNLLATTGSKRYSRTPDTPSFAEFIKGYEPCVSEFGLLGPLGLPPEVLSRLSRAVKETVEDPDIVAKLNFINYDPAWCTPDEYRLHVQHNLLKYGRAVKAAGIQAA